MQHGGYPPRKKMCRSAVCRAKGQAWAIRGSSRTWETLVQTSGAMLPMTPTKMIHKDGSGSRSSMEGQCGNNSRLQQKIAATTAVSQSNPCHLPLISSSLCACVWNLRTFGGSCAGKHAPVSNSKAIEIAVEDHSSHVASTSRSPHPRAHRRTPTQARIARHSQQRMTFIPDWWVSFRIIQGLNQNVGIWPR